MGYVEDLLVSNERIVYTARKHWIAPLFASVAGSLITLGALAALFGSLFVGGGWFDSLLVWGGWLALLVGLVLLARAFVIWWSLIYVVTNHKVMKVSGIMRKTAAGSALEKINDTTISQPLLGRALGYGTVQVLTAADESDLRFRVMSHPMEFRRAILDAKQAWEQQQAQDIADAVRAGQQLGGPTAAIPAVPPPNVGGTGADGGQASEQITALISRLAALRDSGAITDGEFEQKKAELLGRL
jgi:hypothetical protein